MKFRLHECTISQRRICYEIVKYEIVKYKNCISEHISMHKNCGYHCKLSTNIIPDTNVYLLKYANIVHNIRFLYCIATLRHFMGFLLRYRVDDSSYLL